MAFKIGDRIRGVRADIDGCEGVVREIIYDVGVLGGFYYGIELTKIGSSDWHGKEEWQVGSILRRRTPWGNCIELIEPETKGAVLTNGSVRHLLEEIASYNYEPTTDQIFMDTATPFLTAYEATYKPKQTITMKITNAFKKYTNPDVLAQVKAGFRDESLTLTAEGRNAAIEALLDASADAKAAFTAAANEVVAEQENQS